MASGDKKVVSITRVTGQGEAYLAELLPAKSREVHGLKRRSPSFSAAGSEHICRNLHSPDTWFYPHYRDLTGEVVCDAGKRPKAMSSGRPFSKGWPPRVGILEGVTSTYVGFLPAAGVFRGLSDRDREPV